MPSPETMTRAEMDRLVIEAMTVHPEAQLDPAVLEDLALAQKLLELSRTIEPLMQTAISQMKAKLDEGKELRLLEVGMFLLAPRIDAGLTPRIPVVAAMFAMMCSALIGMQYLHERRINPGTRIGGPEFERFVLQHADHCLAFVIAMPKVEFLESMVDLLTRHNTLNPPTGGTTA